MAAKKSAPRVTREEASDRLIRAVIDLLADDDMVDITVDRATEKAGLASGHVLVHRYFGSRTDLMSAVARRLATEIVSVIDAPLDEKLNPTGDPATGGLLSIGRGVELIRRRALVLAELQTVAADPLPHADDYQSIYEAVRRHLAEVVTNERMLKPIAYKVLALIHMEATQRAWTGTSDEDRADIRRLILGEMAAADEVARKLGW